jgi:uncharacterized protein
VENFRSFRAEHELSYVTTSDRTHETTQCIRTGIKSTPRVSRTALIFGPNAAGKTNLILALATLRELVLNSASLTDQEFADRCTPFGCLSALTAPTQFGIDVLLDGVRYRYLVAYAPQRIISERLLVYRTGKSQRWFQRYYDAARDVEEWEPFSPSFYGPREVWRKATRPRALFLTTAAQLNSQQLKPLFNWFSDCLEIVSPRDINNFDRLATHVENPELKARVLQIVRSAGTPIRDFRLAERDLRSSSHTNGDGRASIEFLHSCGDEAPIWLSASFEAAGVNRLFGLLAPILRTIDTGKLLVIDDFDTNLHPILARFLMQQIQNPVMTRRGAQLLLTSHNTTLMDLDILRRDEIWLMELDHDQSSRLGSLTRQSPRKREMIGKAYLRGRYGAIPRTESSYLADVSPLPALDKISSK